MRHYRNSWVLTRCVLLSPVPMIVAVCLLSASTAQAILLPGTLSFTDGDGTALVDQYRGRSGDGWLEGWVPSGTIVASVVDTNPLGSGGNYLSLADIYGGRGVTRQFLAPTTYPYRLMLDLRVDDIPTTGSRTINLSTGSVRSVNTNNTNYVQANATQGGNWRFHGDGTTNTSTIPLVAGTTYHFDFLIDPVQWKFAATVSDGTNSYSTGLVIPFREQQTLVGNPFFELGSQGGSTDPPFTFSLDNIRFAPEPSSHFTDGGTGSDWSTAGNWDNGVPVAATFAHIGAGNAATLTTTGAEAFQVIIGHTAGVLPGNGTLSQTGGDLAVANGLLLGVNTAGSSHIAGGYTATGGATLTVGRPATGRADLYLGYNSAGTSYDATGVLDLSGAAQFDAYLNNLVLGEVTSSVSTGRGAGTLKLAATNNIDATQIVISNSSMHAAHQLWSAVELGNENNIQTDLLVVGGRRGRATLGFAAPGGTLNLTGSSGAAADLRVAYTDLNTGSSGNATMNLAGGTFNATLNDIVVAYHMSKGGTDTGTLTFDAGTVTAESLTVGWAGSHSTEGKGIAVGTVNMGGGSFSTTTAVLGTGEGTATGTFNLSGGTFTSGSLVLGHGLVHAGTGDGTGTGTLNVSAGTAQINGNATLGTGTAASSGTINLTGGQLNVTGNVTGGVGANTLNVDGGTMTVGGDLIVDTLQVGAGALVGDLTVSGGGTVEIGSETNRTNLYIARTTTDIANNPKSTVDFSGAGQLTAYLNAFNIGERTGGHTSNSGKPIAEVILAPTTLIDAATILISEYDMWGANAQQTRVRLGADTTVKTDLLTVAGSRGNALVDFIADGTFKLEGSTGAAADLRVGYCTLGTTNATTGSLDLSGGTFNATLDNLIVGYRVYRGGADVTTTAAMSFDAGTVTANTVTLGWGTQPTSNDGTMGIGIGTLNMGGGSLTADTVRLGFGTSKSEGTLNLTGGTMNVTGSVVGGIGTSTLNVDGGTMTVGGNLSADTVRVGYESRTASLSVGTAATGTVAIGTGSENLFIGRRVSNINIDTVGTLDASDAASFSADVGTLVIGSLTNNSGSGNVTGTLKLPAVSTIDADIIRLGYISGGNVRPVTGSLELGEQTTIRTDTLIVGDHKGIGNVGFLSGGTLTLSGKSGQKADLRIGDNSDSNTSSTATGTMNLSGGVFVANLGQLVLGDYASDMADPGGFGSGSAFGTLTIGDSALNNIQADSVLLGNYARDGSDGSGTTKTASGTITMRGGTFTVVGDVTRGVNYGAANEAVSESIVNLDGGTMTVGGDLKIDALRIGYHADGSDPTGRTASLSTSGGGDVEIGNLANRTNLYVGWTDQNLTQNINGVLDLSGSATFTAHLDNFIIGQRSNGLQDYNGDALGTVTLPDTSYVDARTMILSDQHMWIGTGRSTLTLGADNTLKTDLFTLGGNRANARVEFAAGGTLTLGGSTGDEADLRISYQPLGTGSTANSTADFSGGTLNATLNELIIGFAQGKSTGGGTANGTMIFGAGTVTANSVTIGDANASIGQGTGNGTLSISGGSFTVNGDVTLGTGTTKSEGTLNLSGGTLAAESISGGAGSATFNWTGGRLSVDSFGFDLLQTSTTGPSTLAPGNSPGTTTIYGDYTMNVGTLEIEIAGPEDHDFVMVHGDASLTGDLNVLLLDDYFPDLGTHFDVLQTTGALDIEELTLTGDLPSLTFGWWDMGTVSNGDGFLLRLSAVPEPTGALLALLALAGLLGSVRPRRCAG